MGKDKSDNKVSQKWKSYFTGIINPSIFMSSNKIEKYFNRPISDSTTKAIQENWIRILGIDYEIISLNLCKQGKALGIALEGKYEVIETAQQISHHFLRAIKPNLCIGMSNKFAAGDELLEVNGLKILGLHTKDVIRALKKVTNNFQIVVGRSVNRNDELSSDYGCSEENIISAVSFYDTDEDNESNHTGTLRSVTSNYSTTSRDFGSNVSFSDGIDGKYENVKEYLRNIDGWRGPLIIEFRKHNESLGLALEEIADPKMLNKIIVFKLVASNMKAGKDGRLHVGDRLLEVNGKAVGGIQFRKVCQWMKSSHGGKLVLSICKPHFESTNFNSSDLLNDENLYYPTVDRSRLCKLEEESNPLEIPSVPEYMEKQITLRKKDNKLGLFLDITDNGQNGVRIKRIANNGIAKDDGRLHEGDHIVRINDVSLRLDDKIKLGYCLNQITADTVYNIWYITGEDISLFKTKCLQDAEVTLPTSKLYPDTNDVKFLESSQISFSVASEDEKLSFRTFDIRIENDFQTGLGLVITPSLRDPTRFKSVADIHEGSLAEKFQLRINDEILTVNDTSFENMTIDEVGKYLKKAWECSSFLNFQIRRMVSSDDLNAEDKELMKLSQFPDIYCISLKKKGNSYGFSLSELEDSNGVIVEKVLPNVNVNKETLIKSGHRFAMVNNCPVTGSSKTTIVELVKKSAERLDLVMELIKYREFRVMITKDSNKSLGLNIGGGIDTAIPIPIIESLVPNKKSKFSEDLFPSDYIVEVDGLRMIGMNHDSIINTLRSTDVETTFKIYRQLPFARRGLFSNLESSNFPYDYLQDCRYSVSISKPVESISTFGIALTDVVVLDENAGFAVKCRYKAVLSIESSSLAEKYAPQIKPYHFLVAVNSVPVDLDISCEDFRQIIDSGRNVDLLFSRDIPYILIDNERDHDSPILLRESQQLSRSDNSSEEDFNVQSNSENVMVDNQMEYSITKDALLAVNESEEIVSGSIPETEGEQEMNEEVKSEENVNDIEDNDRNERPLVINDGTVSSNPISSGINETESILKNDEESEDESSLQNIPEETDSADNSETADEPSNESNQLRQEVEKDENEEPETRISDTNEAEIPILDTDKDNQVEVASNELNSNETGNDDKERPEELAIRELDGNEIGAAILDNKKDRLEELEIKKPDSNVTERDNPETENDKAEPTAEEDIKVDLETQKDTQDRSEIKDSDIEAPISELGINIDCVTLIKHENMELGFQMYGGLNGGPNGETLPVFVIGAEKNSCNWPVDREEPLLKNGTQLMEFNGQALSNLPLIQIEQMIRDTSDKALVFRVVTFK